MNLEYCIYPKYSHPLLLTLYFSSNSILLPMNVCKIAGWVANRVDPDTILMASNLLVPSTNLPLTDFKK